MEKVGPGLDGSRHLLYTACMAMGKRPAARQTVPMWVHSEDLPMSDGHPFFERLDRILEEPLAKLQGLRLGAVPNFAGEHLTWPGSPTWEDARHAERWKLGVPTCSRLRVGTPVGD